MTEEDELQLERTLLQVKECHVFKLPERKTADGYLAAEWNKEIWAGSMKILQKGQEAAILLISNDGKVFAVCPVQEGAVERGKGCHAFVSCKQEGKRRFMTSNVAIDSSRYFVLKIQNNKGQHGFIGLAFRDRNDSFDFNVALQEFQKDVEREKKLKDQPAPASHGSSNDLSLKQGQKIHIKLKSGSRTRAKRQGSGSGFTTNQGGLLAPPPADVDGKRRDSGTKSTLAHETVPTPTRQSEGIFDSWRDSDPFSTASDLDSAFSVDPFESQADVEERTRDAFDLLSLDDGGNGESCPSTTTSTSYGLLNDTKSERVETMGANLLEIGDSPPRDQQTGPARETSNSIDLLGIGDDLDTPKDVVSQVSQGSYSSRDTKSMDPFDSIRF